ncbi:MAG: phosphate signaling complex protein PhoU [Proteobacteria bacterium]|nr:phosphate signaling complex protein PhoU [Pseudomonadota bacterium]MBU1708739.1 phosphate signaling complex protein PhoU [Pseudomonadota bacterium]
MIKNLDMELKKLKNKILQLGSEVEKNLFRAEKALLHWDETMAREIIESDENIDDLEISVEERCLRILAQLQPVAGDLRFVVTVLKINNDLERIGDLVVKIADRVLIMLNKNFHGLQADDAVQFPEQFAHMFTETKKMVKMCLDAFVDGNADLAYKVCIWDDEVDKAKNMIRIQIEEILAKDAKQQQHLGMLLSVSRSLERIADHATHIAEDVIYMLRGQIVRHEMDNLE